MAVKSFYKNNQFEWVDVEKPNQQDLDFLESNYGLNPMFLEDALDVNHLPKFEEEEGTRFFLTRVCTDLERRNLSTISDVSTKLSLFVQADRLITIHRIPCMPLENVISELQEKNGNDGFTPDDVTVKILYQVLESYDLQSIKITELLEKAEDHIFDFTTTAEDSIIKQLYRLKRRSALNAKLLNLSQELLSQSSKLNVPAVQLVDLNDKYKDVMSDFDHLNSSITNIISLFVALSDMKANQTMKVLAIASVYFLPITFIAGLYGMNFDNMPELHTRYGYFATLGVMAAVVLGIYLYSRKKKW